MITNINRNAVNTICVINNRIIVSNIYEYIFFFLEKLKKA